MIKDFQVLVVSHVQEQLNRAKTFVQAVGGGNNPKNVNVVRIRRAGLSRKQTISISGKEPKVAVKLRFDPIKEQQEGGTDFCTFSPKPIVPIGAYRGHSFYYWLGSRRGKKRNAPHYLSVDRWAPTVPRTKPSVPFWRHVLRSKHHFESFFDKLLRHLYPWLECVPKFAEELQFLPALFTHADMESVLRVRAVQVVNQVVYVDVKHGWPFEKGVMP